MKDEHLSLLAALTDGKLLTTPRTLFIPSSYFVVKDTLGIFRLLDAFLRDQDISNLRIRLCLKGEK